MNPDLEKLNIQHFDIIDSTNNEAARQIEAILSITSTTENKSETILSTTSSKNESTKSNDRIPLKSLHKKIIVADSQTAGKGRLNRSFYSPNSTGVYMSFIWVIDEADSLNADSDGTFNPALYTATSAVGVTRAIKSVYGIDTQIKWVNDVYLGEKKICGILAEGKIDSQTGKIAALIVGIGVNIATPKDGFPADVERKAGALFDGNNVTIDKEKFSEKDDIKEKQPLEIADSDKKKISQKGDNKKGNFHKDELIRNIAQNVFQIYEDKSLFPSVMQEYREKSNLIGKHVTVSPVINQSENDYEVEVLDITENAELKVKLLNGEIRELSSGEVSLHWN